MTKHELIAALNKESTSHYDAGVSKTVVEAVLDSLGEVAAAELKKGGEITLPGIGKLSVSKRAARTGRNPATGESIKIKAKNVPKFSAAKALKDAVS
ncbi:MAG: HU family DNA-binding protein [Gallionellaceae bacterium]